MICGTIRVCSCYKATSGVKYRNYLDDLKGLKQMYQCEIHCLSYSSAIIQSSHNVFCEEVVYKNSSQSHTPC